MPILNAEPQSYPDDLLTGLDHQSLDRHWWVLQTKPRQEKSLARDLRTREISYYLPQVAQTSLARGRRRTSHIPLFTGYVFMFGDARDRVSSLTTNRICNTLAVDDTAQLTHDLLQIWRLVESRAPLTIESRLKVGDRVRVKKGTLAGVEGSVIDRRGRCRVLVAVHLLQQGVSMEIDDYMLEPI
ncbi:MAG: transcription termination/antitermination protein NusG [Pirellulales bacterium]